MRKVPVGTTLVPPNNVRLSRSAEAKPLAHPVRRGHRGSPDSHYQLRGAHSGGRARLWSRQRRIPSNRRASAEAALNPTLCPCGRTLQRISAYWRLPTGSQRAAHGSNCPMMAAARLGPGLERSEPGPLDRMSRVWPARGCAPGIGDLSVSILIHIAGMRLAALRRFNLSLGSSCRLASTPIGTGFERYREPNGPTPRSPTRKRGEIG